MVLNEVGDGGMQRKRCLWENVGSEVVVVVAREI
jgi:hypothetical protein